MTEEEYLIKAGKLFQKKQLTEAKSLMLDCLKFFPNSIEANYNLGLIYGELEQPKKAIKAYRNALNLRPYFELGYLNLGVIYLRSNQTDKAIKNYQKLAKINPDSFAAFYSLGLSYERKNDYPKALKMLKKSIELNPNYAPSHLKAGLVLLAMGKLDASINFFKQALVIEPKFIDAMTWLGTVYENLNYLSDANKMFKKALKAGAKPASIAGPMFSLARKNCDWEQSEIYRNVLDDDTQKALNAGFGDVEYPFTNINRSSNKDLNLRVAHYWSRMMEQQVLLSTKKFSYRPITKTDHRIRLGYLSLDFREHPVTSQIIDLFKHHDRKKFEIYTYSYGKNDYSQLRKTVQQNSDNFIDLYGVDHGKIAERINKDRVDLLIDLVGYTGFEKPDIVAFRPAPVQINYLGFPGTTGANYIDYIIADKIVIPTEDKKFYEENIIYMPGCYQLCSKQESSPILRNRKDFGLPENGIVLGSFNRNNKIEKVIFNSWLNMLKKIPGAVIWIYCTNNIAKRNLRKYANISGIDPKRLIFTGKLPLHEHISRLKLVDIALDTQIYSGGATTANLLWAGIPVVTIYGDHFLSRMSSSILINLDLKELVTANIKEYENLVVKLANNPKLLTMTKVKIQKNLVLTKLFDSKLFTSNLEKAYLHVWRNYLQGKKTDIII